MKIAIDFDGTLYAGEYRARDAIDGDPVHGAREFVAAAMQEGHYCFILTSRMVDCSAAMQSRVRNGIQAWCRHHLGVSLDVTGEKHSADIYIDDRGYCFDSWSNALAELRCAKTRAAL